MRKIRKSVNRKYTRGRFWNCEKQIFSIVEFFFIGSGIFCLRGTTGGLRSVTRAFSALRRTSDQSRAATSRGASWPI
jgi:hypothetical protein